MILCDLSSLIHRALHTSIRNTNPHKKDGKYITEEFINVAIYRIIEEILYDYENYKRNYNSMVICIDDHSKPYWRKEIYPDYKAQRKKGREESDINYHEVFKHINLLTKVLNDYTPFKSIGVPGAEADDIIGVLTRKYALSEKILILSPDKDFKQLHKFGDVKQWSSATNSWVINDNPDDWEVIHCCLGDAVDNVPRVVDFTKFTPEFKAFYRGSELDFYNLEHSEKIKIHDEFRLNYPDVEIYAKPRFGEITLKKMINECGSLDAFLDSNPIYRLNYERNRMLVLDEKIPAYIEVEILNQFSNSPTDFDLRALSKYFNHYGMPTCIQWFEQLALSGSAVVEMTKFNLNFDKLVF